MVVEVTPRNQPILIEDIRQRSSWGSEQLLKLGIQAAGCFPLRLGDKPIGAMWIFYEKSHYFSREVDALRLYVN